MKKNKKIFAFSLAEALITLLIVALITLATVPVITKKHRERENHGKWICTLNAAGQHIQWSTGASGDANNPATWAVAGNSCTFQVPSTGARNFAITAVGGGGGGAGAQYQNKAWTSDFAVNYYGKYKAVAIGGGGQGGKNKDCGRGGGGGAGGVGYTEFTLDENVTQIKITKGQGGDSSNYNGASGGSSIVSKVYRNSVTGNTETKNILEAKGGGGGGGRYGMGCKNGSGQGGAQGTLVGYTKSFNSSAGKGITHCDKPHCFGYTSVTSQDNVNKLISPYQIFQTKNSSGTSVTNYYISQIGRGGDPPSASSGYSRTGVNGAAIVMTEIYWAGGGGTAGEHKIRDFHPSFDKKKLTITIGKGGKGGNAGTSSGSYATKGEDGGATVIGDLYGLPGGKGGQLKYQEQAFTNTAGEDGEKTPLYYKDQPALGLGGLSGSNTNINGLTSAGYGAGGGGGGVKPGTSSGSASAGKGGDGAPGYVLIEW